MKNFYQSLSEEEFEQDPEKFPEQSSELVTFADECPILENFDDDLVKTLGPKQAAGIIKQLETDCNAVDLR